MDLNYLYAQHQLSLMRADTATNQQVRAGHLIAADTFGNQIRNYQFLHGASAAAGRSGRRLFENGRALNGYKAAS